MRKVFKGIVIVALLVVCFVCVAKVNRTVVRKGYVDEVQNGIVTIVDTAGVAWEWEAEEGEGFAEGDYVKMVMDNNNTEQEIEDDVIVKIRLAK